MMSEVQDATIHMQLNYLINSALAIRAYVSSNSRGLKRG